jgi:hypothetical protein
MCWSWLECEGHLPQLVQVWVGGVVERPLLHWAAIHESVWGSVCSERCEGERRRKVFPRPYTSKPSTGREPFLTHSAFSPEA